MILGGPGGIRTHDLSNANAVSYRTRRPALLHRIPCLAINTFNVVEVEIRIITGHI